MAAISLSSHPDPQGFIAAFSGEDRFIADYLAEEVIALQPEPLRQFLLRSSILDRFSAPLCAAVTDIPESQRLLEEIERKGLFLVPLDPARHWFRFHHLFTDMLRTRLHQTEPDLIPGLHRRAADWCAANGLAIEAVEHSLAARDWDRVAELIEQTARGWLNVEHSVFGDLMLKLPPEVTSRRPGFCTYQAFVCLLTGRLAEASALIDMAERHPSLSANVAPFLALMRADIAEQTGQPYTISDQVLRAPGYIPEENIGMRSTADMTLASILYRNGQFDEAAALATHAADRDLAGHSTVIVPGAVSLLARMLMIRGQVDEAAALCRRYLAITTERGASRFFVDGMLLAALADALRLQGDLTEAEAQAREAVRQNDVWAMPNGIASAAQALARIRLAAGDAAGALDVLAQEEAATRGRTLSHDWVADRAAVKVQAWLALGDVGSAERWAREGEVTAQDQLSFRHEVEHIALARVLLATGRKTEADALISRLAAAAEAAGRSGRLDEIRSLKRKDPAPLADQLSPRELEILGLLAKGMSNQEIAGVLFVAVGTVKAHVHNIFRKLDAPSRTRALARARELGLLK